MHSPTDIVTFWRQAGSKKWFKKDEAFDTEIRMRFEAAHHAAARGELADWAREAEGAYALLLLLDQFPRNLYRGSAHQFATDGLARAIASAAIAAGFDQAFSVEERTFFYLPFEHSEAAADQARSIALYEATGDAELLKWARIHSDVIARFGRFPHRNESLGRVTTPEEQAFLDGGGFAG